MSTRNRQVRGFRVLQGESHFEVSFLRQVKALGLPDPEREMAFGRSVGRRWRFDLAWPEVMLAAEIDGGTYSGGRHVSPLGFERDAEKMSWAAILGWRVLRFTSKTVESGYGVQMLAEAFKRLGETSDG